MKQKGELAVIGCWGVAAAWRTQRWILRPTSRTLGFFMAIGVGITMVTEWLATGVLARWVYADEMPVIPGLETGLLPVLQWVALPPLVVWFVRRQSDMTPGVTAAPGHRYQE